MYDQSIYGQGLTTGAADIEEALFVKLAAGLVVVCDADDDAILGVTDGYCKAGKPACVIVAGMADVQVSAALSGVLGEVATDANGRAKDAASGDTIGGLAMEVGVAPASSRYARAKVLLPVIKPTKA